MLDQHWSQRPVLAGICVGYDLTPHEQKPLFDGRMDTYSCLIMFIATMVSKAMKDMLFNII